MTYVPSMITEENERELARKVAELAVLAERARRKWAREKRRLRAAMLEETARKRVAVFSYADL